MIAHTQEQGEKMANYENSAGTKMTVANKGKGFTSALHFLATKRMPAETMNYNHRSYSGVERMIKKWRMVEVA